MVYSKSFRLLRFVRGSDEFRQSRARSEAKQAENIQLGQPLPVS
jgi:hypothetical protein